MIVHSVFIGMIKHILCILLVAVFGSKCYTATLTVGPSQTYSTISSAITAATDGDILSVYTDTYAEDPSVSKNNLSIVAASGQIPIINGKFSLSATNITFRGLIISEWSGLNANGIHSYTYSGLTVENCIIRNGPTGSSGIYTRDAGNILIRSNIIHNCASGVNINSGRGTSYSNGTRILSNTISSNYFDGIDVNCVYLIVDGNRIFNNFDTNWAANHPDGIQFVDSTVDGQTGVQESQITRNIFYNHTQNIFTSWFTTNCLIANNICYMDAGTVSGVDLDSIATKNIICWGGTGIKIYNNTLGRVNNSSINLTYEATQPRMSAEIKNNIITDVIGAGIGLYIVNASDISTIDNNLYYNNVYDARIASTYYTTVADFKAATAYEDNSVSGNPLLTSWIPALGSPAINVGYDTSALFTTDILGNTRTVPWDIGAYEYIRSRILTVDSIQILSIRRQ